MELPNEKIKLYAVRDFGQSLTVVMDFLRQNWKPVLIYLTYILLPLSLVQALSLNGFMGGYLDILGSITTEAGDPSVTGMVTFALSLLAYLSLYIVGSLLMYGVVFGLMRIYERGEGKLGKVTWQELKPDFMLVLKRSVMLTLVGIVIGLAIAAALGAVMFLLAMISAGLVLVGYLLLLVVLVFLMPPLSLITPAYVFEDDINLIDAIKKGCRLGFGTYFFTIGVMLVLGFIINIASQFTALPWSIMFFIKMFFGLGIDGLDGSFTENVFYTFGTYLTGVLQCFGGYLSYVAIIIGSGYLYGHAAEKIDGRTVEQNIRNFENL